MCCVRVACSPNFVQQKSGWWIGGPMKIVRDAALFFARGADQGPQFGFE